MKVPILIGAVLILSSAAFGQTSNIQDIALQASEAYKKQEYLNARVLSSYACDKGHAESCFNLGVLLERSLGGQVDIALATAKYGKACRLKSSKACRSFGRLSVRHENSFEMRKTATRYLGENCKNKDYEACSILGIESYKAKLYDNAKQFLIEPCNKGKMAYACYNLGLSFKAGPTPNTAAADSYAEKACSLGYIKACENRAP